MIYTVTFNPSLDYVMHVGELKIQETNRSQKEELYAGGKGINVSVILHRLHMETAALGFTAGFTGDEIIRKVKQEGVSCRFIRLRAGESRINVKLKHHAETEINAVGPRIDEQALHQLYAQLDQLKAEDWLILSGSIPIGMPDDTYEKILCRLQYKKIKFIVDAEAELLRKTLPFHPFMIKPNVRELEDLFHVKLHTAAEYVHYGRKLQEEGAVNVLISCGKEGALLLGEDGHCYKCRAWEGPVENSVGAGDSMVAGFLAGYVQTHSLQDALRLGTAAGCATAFEPALANEAAIRTLYDRITCEKIS